MSTSVDYSNEDTGSYVPPKAPEPGDDGYVAHGDVDVSELVKAAEGPVRKMNAADIRSGLSKHLDTIASRVDWSRHEFAKQSVSYLRGMYPEFNWVMCYPAHSYLWMGARGVDWEHSSYWLDTYGIGGYTYEVYWAREGVFTLNGDGGYINWAYIGNVKKLSDKVLSFSP